MNLMSIKEILLNKNGGITSCLGSHLQFNSLSAKESKGSLEAHTSAFSLPEACYTSKPVFCAVCNIQKNITYESFLYHG